MALGALGLEISEAMWHVLYTEGRIKGGSIETIEMGAVLALSRLNVRYCWT